MSGALNRVGSDTEDKERHTHSQVNKDRTDMDATEKARIRNEKTNSKL